MPRIVKKSAVKWLLVMLVALPLIGCNTMEGIGKDAQEAGRALEESAESND